MTNRTQHLTYHDVKPHIEDYVVKSFPVDRKNWKYDWYYENGAETVQITLTINEKTMVHNVSVLSIVGSTSE
jgi:hypothetical protein